MVPVKKAVILAAGLGSRLGYAGGPKPMTPVNGVPILHRALRELSAEGVLEAVVVVGHRADDIERGVGPVFRGMRVTYVRSRDFAVTNNAYSLWLARHHLDQDVFVLDGDVLFDATLLRRVADADAPLALAVAPWETGMHGTVVELDGPKITRVSLLADQGDGGGLAGMFKTVNIQVLRRSYLTAEFLPALDRLVARGDTDAFYDAVIAEGVRGGRVAAQGVDCGDLPWQEVDDLGDLDRAEYVFASADEKLALIRRRHGGTWRYPVTDHDLLYNVHFPPPDLWQSLSAGLRDALVHYPVGQDVVRELLAAAVECPAEYLAVANGASELIKILPRLVDRAVLTLPGFNEYEAVFGPARSSAVHLTAPDFTLDPDDVRLAVEATGAQAAIVTSPNNPTGRAVPTEQLRWLAKLLEPSGAYLVVDESFVDFCHEERSLEHHLADHTNLVIVKSMSKAYGLAGLRLGYLASSDARLVARVREELPIWNVNGLAELFLHHLPEFREDFRNSVERVRSDRDELSRGLAEIAGLRVFPSDANFVMARLPAPWSGPAVVRELFTRHRILIKDCSGKSMADGERYVRIASRTAADNQFLVTALAAVLRGKPG